MKSLLTVAVFFLATAFSIREQKSSTTLAPLLELYLQTGNALVNSDAESTASKAGEFAKNAKSIDLKTLSDSEVGTFVTFQKKLVAAAEQIAANRDITKQRNYFADLSRNFISLAKTVKISEQPLYLVYCPMKKEHWISNEKSVMNPYYGKSMLTCGKIIETISP